MNYSKEKKENNINYERHYEIDFSKIIQFFKRNILIIFLFTSGFPFLTYNFAIKDKNLWETEILFANYNLEFKKPNIRIYLSNAFDNLIYRKRNEFIESFQKNKFKEKLFEYRNIEKNKDFDPNQNNISFKKWSTSNFSIINFNGKVYKIKYKDFDKTLTEKVAIKTNQLIIDRLIENTEIIAKELKSFLKKEIIITKNKLKENLNKSKNMKAQNNILFSKNSLNEPISNYELDDYDLNFMIDYRNLIRESFRIEKEISDLSSISKSLDKYINNKISKKEKVYSLIFYDSFRELFDQNPQNLIKLIEIRPPYKVSSVDLISKNAKKSLISSSIFGFIIANLISLIKDLKFKKL